MRKFSKIATALVLLGTLFVAGCGTKYVAKVNGDVISVDDYKTMARIYNADLKDKNQREQILQNLINDKVAVQFAAEKGIKISDEDIQKDIDQMVKQNFGGDRSKLDAQLKNAGFTIDDYKWFKKTELAKTKLQEAFLKPSDAEIRKYFDDNKKSIGDMAKASHILVSSEKAAKDIIKQLNSGADFGKLAVAKSIEPAAKQTKGDLGWFVKGTMVPEFEKAVFAMKPGEISKNPVSTQFGFHVIKLAEIKPVDYATIKNKIRDLVTQKKYQEFTNQLSKKIKEAKVEKKTENIPTQLEKKSK